MRGTSSEETLQTKESHERLAATHRSRLCTYRSDNGRYSETLFKEAIQTCRQQISYYGVGSNHQNEIFERRIKELALGSRILLIHTTRLWPEAVKTMLWNFYFKAASQRYNSLEIENYRKTPEQKFADVEFQNFPTDYHTWGCPYSF